MRDATKSVRFCHWWLAVPLACHATVATGQQPPVGASTDPKMSVVKDDSEVTEFSPFYFEKKLDRATKEVEFLREKAAQLESLDARIDIALKDLASFKGELAGPTGLETRLASVEETFKALGVSATGDDADDTKPPVDSVGIAYAAMRDLPDQLSEFQSDANSVTESVYSLADALHRIRQQRRGQSAAYDDVVSDVASDFGGSRDSGSRYFVDWLSRIRDSTGGIISANAVPDMARLKSAMFTEVSRFISSLNRAESIGNKLKQEVEQELSSIEGQLETAESEEQQARDQLKKAYKEYQSGAALNTWLVAAIILMIVAMVVLYLSLWFFRPAFARTIIQQRVLIELMSMSFLLLTVIILGTGRLLDSTALAALLGTMAGYIFGQKQKRKKGNGNVATEPDPIGQAPTL